VLLTVSACARRVDKDETNKAKGSAILEARESRLTQSLAQADSGNAGANHPLARWLLPAELSEISGLALTPDERLFAHNDESARITEIDYRRGTIIKRFYAGEKSLRGDFEGITFGDNRFFLMTSNGVIYEFPEGEDGDRVDCTVFDTHLGAECEFEGIAYDPQAKDLVLSCKNVGRKKDRDQLVFYRYTPNARQDIRDRCSAEGRGWQEPVEAGPPHRSRHRSAQRQLRAGRRAGAGTDRAHARGRRGIRAHTRGPSSAGRGRRHYARPYPHHQRRIRGQRRHHHAVSVAVSGGSHPCVSVRAAASFS
jgi:hypothetical protein